MMVHLLINLKVEESHHTCFFLLLKCSESCSTTYMEESTYLLFMVRIGNSWDLSYMFLPNGIRNTKDSQIRACIPAGHLLRKYRKMDLSSHNDNNRRNWLAYIKCIMMEL